MTKQEFIDDVTSLDDLYRVVCDGECYDWFGMEPADTRDEYINDSLCEWVRDCSWQEARNMLDQIDDDAEYYMRDDWSGADDWAAMYEYNLELWKIRFIEDAEYNDFFAEEDDEDELVEEDGTFSVDRSWQKELVPEFSLEFEIPGDFAGIYNAS